MKRAKTLLGEDNQLAALVAGVRPSFNDAIANKLIQQLLHSLLAESHAKDEL